MLVEGELFGEEEIIGKTKREKSVICDSLQGTLLYIRKCDFFKIMEEDEEFKAIIVERVKQK